jgi:hypothetical protein
MIFNFVLVEIWIFDEVSFDFLNDLLARAARNFRKIDRSELIELEEKGLVERPERLSYA